MRHYLVNVIFCGVLFLSSIALSQPTEGLVGYWTLDGNDTAVPHRNAVVTDDGIVGGAYLLSGGRDSVSLLGFPDVFDSNFTLSFWCKITEPNPNGNVPLNLYTMRKGFFILEDSVFSFYAFVEGSFNVVHSVSYPDQTDWHNVVLVYSDGYQLFIDGVSVDQNTEVTGPVERSSGEMPMVGSSSSNEHSWRGMVDDIRVYNRDLSDAEVSDIYTSVISPVVDPNDDPNEVPVSDVNDTSGNIKQTFRKGSEDSRKFLLILADPNSLTHIRAVLDSLIEQGTLINFQYDYFDSKEVVWYFDPNR